jgi:hypothetical protein
MRITARRDGEGSSDGREHGGSRDEDRAIVQHRRDARWPNARATAQLGARRGVERQSEVDDHCKGWRTYLS